MTIHDFIERHVPWRYGRLYYRAVGGVRRMIRRLRYRRMPTGGWGEGWRVLVFRLSTPGRPELHVLAPVRGDTFDLKTLRIHIRGEPWPDYAHEAGKQVGVMAWEGHHTYVVIDGFGPQRLSMGNLVPGEFGGGVDVGFVLVDVRDAVLTDPAQAGAQPPSSSALGAAPHRTNATGSPPRSA